MVEIALLLFLLFLLAVYFLPTFLAGLRGHHATVGIFAVNFFLGWTLIGWIGTLLWAFAPIRDDEEEAWEQDESWDDGENFEADDEGEPADEHQVDPEAGDNSADWPGEWPRKSEEGDER